MHRVYGKLIDETTGLDGFSEAATGVCRRASKANNQVVSPINRVWDWPSHLTCQGQDMSCL
jgi:hypothetical protein